MPRSKRPKPIQIMARHCRTCDVVWIGRMSPGPHRRFPDHLVPGSTTLCAPPDGGARRWGPVVRVGEIPQ